MYTCLSLVSSSVQKSHVVTVASSNSTSCSSVDNYCLHLFDWSLLTNAVFIVYAVSAMLIFTGYPPLYIMLPDHAVKSSAVQVSKSKAAYIVSILGLSDVIGRIGFGILADLNIIPKRFVCYF